MSGYIVKQDYFFTVERGTTWGIQKEATAYALPTEDMTFNIEPNAHRLNRANGVRGQHEDATWQDTWGVVPTASTSVICTPLLMKEVLPGLLQKGTDWVAASNVYTMNCNNYADLPSPKADNDGYFFTLTRNSPEAGSDEEIASAIISSAKFTVSPTDKEGVLTADLEFVGTGNLRGQTSSAVVTPMSLDTMFKWGDLASVMFGSVDLTSDFISAEINVSNGAKLAQDLPTGEVVFPKWEVSGTIKVIANANTEALKDKCLSRDPNQSETLAIAFGNAVPAANGDLVLSSDCYLTKFSSDFTEGEVIEFSFEGVFGDSKNPFTAEFYYL